MRRFKLKFVISFIFIILISHSAYSLNIASWNIQRLGHGDKKDFKSLSQIFSINHFDFIAIQEVMNEKGLESLRQSVSKATGEEWKEIHSHLTGSKSYKEMYAFLWRPSKVEYVNGAVVYLDPEKYFVREPFSAKFKDIKSNDVFLVATVHILFGKNIHDRKSEVKALSSYWNWLAQSFPDTERKIILTGDFNMDPKKEAWTSLKTLAVPLLTEGASTVSSIDGKFANLYDNFWIGHKTSLHIRKVELINAPMQLKFTHELFRATISDHIPIMVEI